MKVTDIIRSVLDIIDHAEDPEPQAVAVVQVQTDGGEELQDMQRLAGLIDLSEPEFANEPHTIVSPVPAAFPAGDDVHHAKNPADIRSDSISMFPDWQARK